MVKNFPNPPKGSHTGEVVIAITIIALLVACELSGVINIIK